MRMMSLTKKPSDAIKVSRRLFEFTGTLPRTPQPYLLTQALAETAAALPRLMRVQVVSGAPLGHCVLCAREQDCLQRRGTHLLLRLPAADKAKHACTSRSPFRTSATVIVNDNDAAFFGSLQPSVGCRFR